jgi:hypothetical protein
MGCTLGRGRCKKGLKVTIFLFLRLETSCDRVTKGLVQSCRPVLQTIQVGWGPRFQAARRGVLQHRATEEGSYAIIGPPSCYSLLVKTKSNPSCLTNHLCRLAQRSHRGNGHREAHQQCCFGSFLKSTSFTSYCISNDGMSFVISIQLRSIARQYA